MNFTPLEALPESLATLFDSASTDLYEARLKACRDRDIDPIDYIDTLTEEETAVIESLVDKGFTLAGIGSARVVISIPGANSVVKLPRYGGESHPLDDGYVQNPAEIKLWTMAEDGMMRNALLPIIDARTADSPDDGPSWVVMPEITPLSEDDRLSEEDVESHLRTVCSVMQESGLAEYADITEVSEQNVALVDGLPRLFDYGRGVDVPTYGTEF